MSMHYTSKLLVAHEDRAMYSRPRYPHIFLPADISPFQGYLTMRK